MLSVLALVLSLHTPVHAQDITEEFHALFHMALLQCPKAKIYSQCDDPNGVSQKTIFDAAVATALKSDRKLLVIIGADWCGPCHVVERILNFSKENLAALEKDFLVVHLEAMMSTTRPIRLMLGLTGDAIPMAVYYDPKAQKVSEPFSPFLMSTVELREGVKDHPLEWPVNP